MKKLICKLGVTSVILIALSMAAQAKEKVYKLKMATTWGPTLSPLIDSAKNMAKYAEILSNGQLKIRVDNSKKHKAPFGILDMVKGGQYDLGNTTSYYYKGKDINTLPFTTMPFGMTTPEQNAWFYYGGGNELLQKVYAKHNIVAFPAGNTGMQMGGWFKKEIKSIKDLKGLKMRIPGFAGEIMAKLGVNATNIPGGELYTALETGVIDALEWVGPSMDINMGFHKITPYYYTGWHEPASEILVMVNKKVYEKLPEYLRQVLVSAIRLSGYDTYTLGYDMNIQAWDKMKKEYPNIKVLEYPKEVVDALKKANQELRDELSKKNPLLKEIFESQDAYMKKARNWTNISDYLYLKSAN